MKKFLLGAFALCAALTVNAQVIVALDADGDLEDPSGTALTGGTVIGGADTSIPVSVKFDDTYKSVSISYGLNINGEDIAKASGYTGNTNPSPGASSASVGDYPTGGGGIYSVTAPADGYFYFIHKASYNKNYVVFEERSRIPYFLSYYDSASGILGTVDLSNGYVDVNGNTASYYDSDWDEWFINDDYALLTPAGYIPALDNAANGVSVIKFKAFEGCEYLCFGTGTKMSLGYVIYSDADNVTITTSPTSSDDTWDPVTICSPSGSTGISSTVINVDSNSGKIYNIAGQRVNSNTKGLLIQDGKKYINK